MEMLWQSARAFLAQPFVTPMSFGRYVALVGLTVIIVILWVFVIQELEKGVREI